MRQATGKMLDQVFGPGTGANIADRALNSSVEFVRSMDQLALATPGARGPRLTAWQAFDAYGFDRLCEVAAEGSVLLCESPDAPGRALQERRLQLGLEIRNVAIKARLTEDVIAALEQSRRRPIREYELVARVLGLDERMVAVIADPRGNDRVAVRLRSLNQAAYGTYLTPSVVASLAEAAWVAMTQIRLEKDLHLRSSELSVAVSDDYGCPGWPAWRAGFLLADELREQLAIDPSDPILSMRELCEQRLRIPVIQANLGEHLAGATIECEGRRAVVLNLMGRNREVFVRRATLAHELAHILYDPSPRLNDLRVDRYEDLDQEPSQIVDYVEQRANAFAVQLVAPQQAAVVRYQESHNENRLDTVVDHYGLSYTAAKYQVWNGLVRKVDLSQLTATPGKRDSAWDARETYTIDYHPVRGIVDYPSRAGRFGAVAIQAAIKRLISWDTAADFLLATKEEVQSAVPWVRDLYPDIFH